MTNRRVVLAGLTAAALSPTGVSFAPLFAQSRTTLRATVIPIFDISPLKAAAKLGYFAEEGLEIDTTPSQGGATGLPALVAGQVQIAFSNIVSIVQGISRGLPLKIIAQANETLGSPPDTAGIVALKAAGFKSGKDLEGKRVAVNTRNNIIWMYARRWIDETGGNSENVTFLEVPFPQMPDALIGKQVDAAYVSQPYLGNLLNNPDAKILGWPYSFENKKRLISQYVATDAYIKKNPDKVESFVRALNRGVDWVNANFGGPEYVSLITSYTRLSEDKVRAVTDGLKWTYQKTVDAGRLEEAMVIMKQYKLIEKEPAIASMLYPTAVTPPK